jgi:hypothetical protein
MIKGSDKMNPFMVYDDEMRTTLRIPHNGWILEMAQPNHRDRSIPTDILCYQADQGLVDPLYITTVIPAQIQLYQFLQSRNPMELLDPTHGFVRFYWEEGKDEYFIVLVHIVGASIEFRVSKNWFY